MRQLTPSEHANNEFAIAHAGLGARLASPDVSAAVLELPSGMPLLSNSPAESNNQQRRWRPSKSFHDHSAIVFALLFLLVSGAGIEVGARYWEAQIARTSADHSTTRLSFAAPAKGPNTAVPVAQLQTKLASIAAQPLQLTIGTQPTTIDSSTIHNWLQVVTDRKTDTSYIHVNQAAIQKSLAQIAQKHTVAPVDQVTATHNGTPVVIVAGRNGSTPGDTQAISQQISANLLAAKGMQFTLPTQTVAYRAVTPAVFSKLIEVDLVSKQMWLYQNGQQIQNYAVSAGAPATPTPVGEFHVYAKYASQNMSGYNADGKTKYFQPNVPWVSYFDGADAIHGVYWHPLSWFGAHNSSHGCVGVPVNTGEWIYNWAPIGTTVITYQS